MATLFALLVLVAILFGGVKLLNLVERSGKRVHSGQPSHGDLLKEWEFGADAPAKSLYRSKRTILSPAEQVFFRALRKAAPDHGVSLKVRIADLLQPEGSGREYMSNFGRIKSRHVDFLLYDAKNFQIVAAVELDDSSHRRQDRQERDEFLDAAFAQAGLPLCRFPVRSSYDPLEIAGVIGLEPKPLTMAAAAGQ